MFWGVKMQETLYEKIYNRIVHDIRTSKLKPGDRVPSEKELADEYKVSRITTKKAMEMLAQSGYIERLRGKGSFVTNRELLAKSHQPLEAKHDIGPIRKSKVIGFIIPEMTDVFGLRLFRAIEERCAELDCRLLIKLTSGNRDIEEAAIRDFIEFGVDGLIVLPVSGEHYNGELLRLILDGFPVMIVDQYFKGIAACSIATDHKKAAYDLTSYLLDKGHANIAYLTSSKKTTTIEDRIQGYTNAIIQKELIMRSEYVVTDLQEIGDFIEVHPEIKAFIANDYNLAIMLEQELQTRRNDSSDVEIVCFDWPQELWGVKQFTSIRQDETRIGRGAVDLLHVKWNGDDYELHNTIEHEMVCI